MSKRKLHAIAFVPWSEILAILAGWQVSMYCLAVHELGIAGQVIHVIKPPPASDVDADLYLGRNCANLLLIS